MVKVNKPSGDKNTKTGTPEAGIADITGGSCGLPHRSCHVEPLDDVLGEIFRIVKLKTGHDFSSYKANTAMRRIERRMAMNEVSDIGKYIALIEESPQEAQALCQDILIGVTSFFRDPEAFAVLRQEVIPRLFDGRDPEDPVRIWHACCATGEEVYSMAILIQEYLHVKGVSAKVQLFATDVDETAISLARAGLYPDDIERDLGRERLDRFFTRTDGRWQVKKQIREMVVFAHHSLIKDPPFSRLDLLVCRNFLIYLNSDMQERLINLFHQVLKTGGVLFLGGSETVGRNSDLFSPIDKKWKLFKRLESKRKMDTAFPLSLSVRMPVVHRPERPAKTTEPTPGIAAERLLMERYSPPCVVVNDKFEMVHVSIRLNRFLEVPTGEPTRDVLRMAREDLRPTLRAAIYKAFAEQKRIEFRGVKVASEEGETTVNLIVEPLGPAPGSKLALVIFEPGAQQSPMADLNEGEGAPGVETSKEMLIRQLEEQLHVTHEQLQTTSEQLETSNEGFMAASEELISINEEFQSANEELQSTNEELETSKEELQALNEELITVNAELEGKVEELNLATSDMENLLASSGIATLFLDRKLHIKGFTPAVAGIFNLIPADIGRPFQHLAGKIDWPTLTRDAATVLAGQPISEEETTTLETGRCYLKRMLPYRTQEGNIDGIVITFIDITRRKQMEEQTVHFASFPQLNPNPVIEVDSAGLVIFANPATRKILESLGIDAANVGVFLPADLDCILRDWDRKSEATLQREIIVRDRVYGATIFLTPQFEVARIYAFDITERKLAQEALAESEQRVRHKLDSIISPEGDIGNLDLADIIDAPSLQALMNDFYELTGLPMGLLDLKGKILVGVGWQDACTKFHRINPDTLRNCVESDVRLSAGVPQGEYKIYKCKNNMWDVATPVMVGDRQFGNLFMGQFFFEDEPPDYELFRSQAGKYGFDVQEYIAALEAVPRLTRETLNTSMSFFMKLAGILSKQSYSNLKLARSLAERDTLMESLRESEERLNRAQEISHLGSWDLDLVKNRLSWSDEVYRIFGLQPQEFDATYEAFLEVVHPDDQAAVNAAYSASLREGRDTYEIEHRVVRKASGEVRIVLEKCDHLRDVSGQITRSIGMVHDITERKWAEAELLRAHNELEIRVAERTEDLEYAVANLKVEVAEREIAEESVLRLNRLYAVLSETNQAIIRTRDQETLFNDFCRIAVEHGIFKLSWVGLVDEKSGKLKIVAAQGATGYLDDIEITANEEPAGLGPTGISVREGTYYICNDFLDSPITRPWHDRARAHGICASASIAMKQEGRVIGALTLYADKKDFFDRQQVELLLQMGADVSFALDNILRETSRQEAELALLEETSERLRVVENLREKEQMLIQQSRMAAMGEMIGNIAHQWRQPLNTLGLEIQQLLLFYDLDEFDREFLNKGVSSSMELIRHMSRTIDDFRNYFMPDKEKAEFHVFEAINKTTSLLEGCFKNTKIGIEIVAQDRPLIYGYQNEFAQVILNILVNARDALIERKIHDPQVTITLGNEHGCAVVTITDNAGGIPEEIMGKIFDPYFTTKGPQTGTGVGLFMSKTIIEKNMGGRLTVCNRADGAEFRIEV